MKKEDVYKFIRAILLFLIFSLIGAILTGSELSILIALLVLYLELKL